MAAPVNNPRSIYVLPADSGLAESTGRISLDVVTTYLWASRVWILVFGILGAAAGIGIFSVSTRVYESETLLFAAAQPDRAAGALSGLTSQLGGAAGLMGLSLNGLNSSRTEALTVLRSPGFINYFIERHNLMPILYSKLWDPASKSWKVSDPSKIPTEADAELYFSTRVLDVRDDKTTGVVTVAVQWRDRFLAAQWANDIVSDLNESLRSRAVQETSAAIDYLNKILSKGSIPEVEQQAVYNLIEGQMATSTMANVRQQYAFKVLDAATPSDPDRFIKPNLMLLLAGYTFASIIFGLVVRHLAGPRLASLWARLRSRPKGIEAQGSTALPH